MSDIAVIVPVVGRPHRAAEFMASSPGAPVYAMCEADDQASIDAWQAAGAHVMASDARTFAEKVNLAYQNTTEPWLLLVGDDVKFHSGWQDAVMRAAEGGAKVIGTNDLLAPNAERAVHPVISRAYIDEVGASWDGPGVVAHAYRHWFVDNEIQTAARQRGVWAYAPDAVIEHLHFLNGKAERDEVYDRGFGTSEEDRAEFEARLAANQPTRKLRTCVYGVAKDEAKHVARWATTALAESDYVVLVDTGSTDDTVQIARDLGVIVHQISVVPWRFDMARNAALALLPADADVCISLDMDEWLQPGWRKALETQWDVRAGTGKLTLRFVDGEGPDANVTLEYLIDRVHHRQGAKWVLPCHEIITNLNPGQALCPGVVIHHLPDSGKDRSQRDMPLLQLGVQENPDDARSHYYLGRQFFYANDWVKARAVLSKYLEMPTARFDQERSEACRFIARMVFPDQQERWYLRACYEAPQRREPWAELAGWYGMNGRDVEAAGIAARVLTITEKGPMNSFHVEPWAWNDDTFKELIEKAKR